MFATKNVVLYTRTFLQAVIRGLLTPNPRFRPYFAVDKVVLGQVSLRVFVLSPVAVIPSLLHIHSHIIWLMEKRTDRDPVP